MQLSQRFEVGLPRDEVVDRLCRDETLLGLLPEGDTEIVDRAGDRRTARTRYTALGREGVATFHFDYLMDGGVRFEKICDGRVWRELKGRVEVEELADDRCEVRIDLDGRTKSLVPEFTIKGPMDDQIRQMSANLKRRLGDDASVSPPGEQ